LARFLKQDLDVKNPLNHRDVGKHGQQRQCRYLQSHDQTDAENHQPLRPGSDPDFVLEPKTLRPRPSVADHERADDHHEREGWHDLIAAPRGFDEQTEEERGFRESVEGRVEEGPEGRRSVGDAGQGAVQHVKGADDQEQNPTEREIPKRQNNANAKIQQKPDEGQLGRTHPGLLEKTRKSFRELPRLIFEASEQF